MNIQLDFTPITIDSRRAIQQVTLHAGRRNCNFTFANLIGWQFLFNTEYCIAGPAVVLRFRMGPGVAYMVCSAQAPDGALLEALRADAALLGDGLRIVGLEDEAAAAVAARCAGAVVEPMRNSYDYIYLRDELQALAGKSLKAKRNHVNKFLSEHPGYEYRRLEPALFAQCIEVEDRWNAERHHDNPAYGDTTQAERRVMERVFGHWEALGMEGGSIFVDGRMVAFTYGAPVTVDTFDVCVEKADREVDGAFSIINQQFVAHLPEQYRYINREEDMGIEGLRKAKLSYHPHQLLSYNTVTWTTACNG